MVIGGATGCPPAKANKLLLKPGYYTSLMTMMKTLETKGYLKRRRRDRALAELTESSHRARTTVRQDRRGIGLTDCFKITRVQNRTAGKSVASNCK